MTNDNQKIGIPLIAFHGNKIEENLKKKYIVITNFPSRFNEMSTSELREWTSTESVWL